jgi:hypothetical protein
LLLLRLLLLFAVQKGRDQGSPRAGLLQAAGVLTGVASSEA